ncbi:MAG: PKD domain-containing protein [Sediminibacterium sp.]|nr:PKD domain-containing protein [Sediminibacterium sp.]
MRAFKLNFLFLLFLLAKLNAQEGTKDFTSPFVSPSLHFTENKGQWESRILYRAQLDGGALFVEKDRLTFNLYDKVKARQFHGIRAVKNKPKDDLINGHAFSIRFLNANTSPSVTSYNKTQSYENYFVGKDPAKWKSNVHSYHKLYFDNLFNGIDYEVITASGGIKYNLYVKPHANPSQIKFQFDGITDIRLKNNVLTLKPSVNEIIERRPYVYQRINGSIKQITCNFVLSGNILSFDFPEGYNSSYELVIDPQLVFAAQSGSSADNFGMTATYDAAGNLYTGGTAFAIGYPTTVGAYSSSFFGPVYYGNTDVVITKYNATGTALLYSTYFGGDKTETVNSLVIDKNNNLCFFGATSSTNIPTPNGAYDNSFNGGNQVFFFYNGARYLNGTDIFIAKLNSSGSTLLASTYYGGSENDGLNYTNQSVFLGNFNVAVPPATGAVPVYQPAYDSLLTNYGDQSRGEIQVDVFNNIYIVSSTRSSDIPMVNGFDNTLNGTQDGLIAKFNSGLTTLIHSSYLGGNSNDAAYGLIVTTTNEVYVTGGTSSQNFPVTAGCLQSNYGGGNADGFVLRVNPNGNSLLNSTYFGTGQYDQSFFIQTDKHQNVYIYGQSLGSIPILPAAGSPSVFNVPNTHQFIVKLNPTLTGSLMSTTFGNYTNKFDISPAAFSVDKCSNIYISGWGANFLDPSNPTLSNMPLLAATQSTTDGNDFYFMGLDSNATTLKYGSYFGGGVSDEHVDGGTSRFDPRGVIYQSVCAGCGGNDDFPVTPGAWPNTPPNNNHSSNCNNGVIKLDFQLQLAVSTINTNTVAGCVPLTVSFTNATVPTGSLATFIWYFGNGQTNTTTINPVVTFTTPGVYTVALVVNDPATCNVKDSSVTYITVHPKPNVLFSVNSNSCSTVISTNNTSTGNFGSAPFLWNFGPATSTLTAPGYTYATAGTYTVSLTATDVNGCVNTGTNIISVFNFNPGVVTASAVCEGLTTTITATGGTSYSWTPSASLNTATAASVLASPSITTIYSVQVNNNSQGYTCSRTLTTQVTIYPKTIADFTFTPTPCTGNVSFTNTSSSLAPSVSVVYNFGDGSNTVTANNPNHTYTASGTYTITLNAVNNFGCSDAISKPVNILIFNPGVVSGATVCQGIPAGLNASGGTSYSWSPSASLNNPSVANPNVNSNALNVGNTIFSVQIINTSNGFNCSRTLTTQVNVLPTPTANFGFSINPCGGGIQFNDASQANITNWLWSYGSSTVSTQNFYYFFNAGYTGTVGLEVTNSDGCKHSIVKPVSVPVPPPVSISSSTNICLGKGTSLSASGGTAYAWSPPAGLDVTYISNPYATPSITTVYSVVISTTNSIGQPCNLVLTTTVNVTQLSMFPISAVANPVVVSGGSPTTLTYLGSPGAFVTWLPPGSTTPASGYTVTAYPTQPTTYTAVANSGPCSEQAKVYVEAYTAGCIDEDTFVPNTFTPNGDGNNDVLYVRGVKVTELYFAVYNRWGELVFETNDKNSGWNGLYKGRPADVGVFGWYLKVKCINGEEAFKKGNVTLIR